MNLQGLLNSRRAGMLALRVSRRLPPKWGYRLADTLADRIAAGSQTPMVQGIRANQWIVSDQQLHGEGLDQAVRETMRHMARSFYTLFHYLEVLERFQNLIDYDARAEAVIAQSQEASQGLVVVGVHMSSFDLVAQASALRGLRALGLSLPQPDEAVEWQHEFRRQAGLEILPASIHNIRQTIERLKAGETVLTGLDRPVPDPLYRPRFFGHAANVPVHYIQLALKARVPLVVMAAIEQPDGRYRVVSSDLIHLERYTDRHSEIVNNAEKILMVAEGFIRQAPQQWAIIQPVWPDLLPQVP